MNQLKTKKIPYPIQCELCRESVDRITIHHLVPKSVQRASDPIYVTMATAWLCLECHGFIHLAFANDELRKFYADIDKIRKSDRYKKWQESWKSEYYEKIRLTKLRHTYCRIFEEAFNEALIGDD